MLSYEIDGHGKFNNKDIHTHALRNGCGPYIPGKFPSDINLQFGLDINSQKTINPQRIGFTD